MKKDYTIINKFTSTGRKLLRQGALLEAWKQHIPIPYSLQVAPTEVCNLNCKFCSVRNRSKKYVFPIKDLIAATEQFIRLGTKTVEITGGGEPLCYPRINQYLNYLIDKDIKIGLITNGLHINKIIDKRLLTSIKWIRISANVFDYTNRIDIPIGFDGALGFSYVWTDGISSAKILEQIKKIAELNNVEYIRLVPNCLGTKGEQQKKNEFLTKVAEDMGSPIFFQNKAFGTPLACYWGYLKPFLYSDGHLYPCSSVVLNSDANRQFHESYRLCHWTKIETMWRVRPISSLIDTKKCDHCVFTEQNEILDYALNKQEHEDFI